MVASVFFIAPLAVHASLYLPGATLNPDCAPTESSTTCGISTTIASSTANSIPYYAANGSILSATSTMTILSNGNIGIGTTSPFAQFSIAGIAGGSTNLFAISTSTAAFATTTALTINQNGDISLGNGANLSVGGNLTVTGTTNLSQPLGIASGGTGAATAATARTALGLPFVSYSTQNNWYNFSAWGDSLTNGAGGDGTTYPAVLQSLFGNRQVYNKKYCRWNQFANFD